jgi:cytochrome c-type biogenesis protein CcmE
MQGEGFKADKIVMKCPSKYQENEIKANGSKGVEAKL